eukprot:3225619-Rhodomonas_salina.2
MIPFTTSITNPMTGRSTSQYTALITMSSMWMMSHMNPISAFMHLEDDVAELHQQLLDDEHDLVEPVHDVGNCAVDVPQRDHHAEEADHEIERVHGHTGHEVHDGAQRQQHLLEVRHVRGGALRLQPHVLLHQRQRVDVAGADLRVMDLVEILHRFADEVVVAHGEDRGRVEKGGSDTVPGSDAVGVGDHLPRLRHCAAHRVQVAVQVANLHRHKKVLRLV